jgi:hypothetical protein
MLFFGTQMYDTNKNVNNAHEASKHEVSKHRNTRRSWRATLSDPEMLLALSAVFISLCAMVLSAVQVIIMRDEQQILREEQHMSVWPRLQLEVSTKLLSPDVQSFEDSTKIKVKITVHNKGVGPALVGAARTFVDGKPATEFVTALAEVLPAKSINAGFSRITERTMLPGDSLDVAVFYAFASNRRVWQSLNRLGLQICYCSVYKDCWQVIKMQMGEGSGAEPVYRETSGCQAE